MATELIRYGLKWVFDADYPVTQYVNGDWAVEGPCTVVVIEHFIGAISENYNATTGEWTVTYSPTGSWVPLMPSAGRHGSMVNPVDFSQAYDDRVANYSAGLVVAFPRTLQPGESLVSTISLLEEDLNANGSYVQSWAGHNVSGSHAKIRFAAVLTCVASLPAAGTFRPPFVGTNKPTYNVSQIDATKWGQFAAPADASLLSTSKIAYLERGLARTWLQHGRDWQCRLMHPVEAMRNYHQGIGEFLSDCCMVMMTPRCTERLLHRFIQTGIDHYHSIIQALADSATFEFHAIYTGLLLGNEDMQNVWIEGNSQTPGRGRMFHYADERTSTINSAVVPSGLTWTGAAVFFRKNTGNIHEHEHLHPSEWHLAKDGFKNETYRQGQDSRPHFGMVLASYMLGAGSKWPNHAPRDYLVRWKSETSPSFLQTIKLYYPSWNSWGTSMHTAFDEGMWDLYKSHVGVGEAPADTTPPIWTTQPEVMLATVSSLTLRAGINEAGTIYYALLPAASAAPTREAIRDQAVVGAVRQGSVTAIGGVPVTSLMEGLPSATAYKCHVVAADIAGNLQDPAMAVDCATLVEPPTPVPPEPEPAPPFRKRRKPAGYL